MNQNTKYKNTAKWRQVSITFFFFFKCKLLSYSHYFVVANVLKT